MITLKENNLFQQIIITLILSVLLRQVENT